MQQDATYDTGKVYARMYENLDMQYDIVYPLAWDHISWDAALENVFRSDSLQYLVYGSLMARNAVSANRVDPVLGISVARVVLALLDAEHLELALVPAGHDVEAEAALADMVGGDASAWPR